MEQREKKISRLRRPFVVAGAIIGVILSGWYLYNSFGIISPVPDPIWLKFVKVSLIMFSSIYLANLLRNVVEFLIRNK